MYKLSDSKHNSSQQFVITRKNNNALHTITDFVLDISQAS